MSFDPLALTMRPAHIMEREIYTKRVLDAIRAYELAWVRLPKPEDSEIEALAAAIDEEKAKPNSWFRIAFQSIDEFGETAIVGSTESIRREYEGKSIVDVLSGASFAIEAAHCSAIASFVNRQVQRPGCVRFSAEQWAHIYKKTPEMISQLIALANDVDAEAMGNPKAGGAGE